MGLMDRWVFRARTRLAFLSDQDIPQPGIMLQLVYNGDPETGAKKHQRFVNLGPVMNQSETIRELNDAPD
jgi:hypothetical protein